MSLIFISTNLIFLLAFGASKPSFDCKLANTDIEKHLCFSKHYSVETINSLDVRMNNIYVKLIANDNSIKKDQIKWLTKRNKCVGPDEHRQSECLLGVYTDRLQELINESNSNDIEISSSNVCFYATGSDCRNNIGAQELPIGGNRGFFLNNLGRSYLVVLDKQGKIDWDASWNGQAISFTPFKKSFWKSESDDFPEYILIKGNYRSGCPDCSTQDTIFINLSGKWMPVNLLHFYRHVGMVSNGIDELYMSVDDKNHLLIVKAAFRDYRENQSEDLSYLTAEGSIKNGNFMPNYFVLDIQ